MKYATKFRHQGRTLFVWGLGLIFAVALLATPTPGLAQVQAGVAVESLAAIQGAAQSHVQGLLKNSGASTVTVKPLDPRLRLARCDSPLNAALPPGAGVQARVTVAVSCAAPRWSIFVPVTVESVINVLVLRHAVDRNAKLSVEDVAVDSRRVFGLATAYLSGADDLEGKVTRRPLAAGSTLAADMFTAQTVVHRGQQITLLAGDGLIEVRAMGKAMMDGAAGARIQVQNLSSSRVVEGVVESAEVVRVGL